MSNNKKIARPYFINHKLNKNNNSYFTPLDIAKIYGLVKTPTTRVGIAIIELGGGYDPNDLNTYWKNLGLTTIPNVLSISVDGAKNSPGNDEDYEVVLDIEVVGGLCPNSNIYVYFASNTISGFYNAVNEAITSTTNPISIISISWGNGEKYWSVSDLQLYNTLFQKAAQLGITICVASGDGESSGNRVDFPASSPWVLSCGGTHLVCPDTNYDSSTTSEIIWGSGGGFSTVFPRPSYQTIPLSNYPTSGRGVPDVCGNADPSTGWQIYIRGGYTILGGTSSVAPLYAALLASVDCKQFANTLLYNYYQINHNIFHDIISGSKGYSGKSGWDPASGLGSPNGKILLPLLSNNIVVNNSGNQTNIIGNSVNLQIITTNSSLNQILTYKASGLPPGLSIKSSTGLISGIPKVTTTSTIIITVDDSIGAIGSTIFTWKINKNIITVNNPGNQTNIIGNLVNLQIIATNSLSNQILTYKASGLPLGLSIKFSTGLISGIPKVTTTSTIIITVNDSIGAIGSTTFTWKINKNIIIVNNPGNQTNIIGNPVNLQIIATNSSPNQILTYEASGLPFGLSIKSSTGLISGIPEVTNASTIIITVNDSNGTIGFTTFTWKTS